MNYIKFLSKQDIIKMLQKCNLKINEDVKNNFSYSQNKDLILISCKKIVLDKSDEALNELISNFTNVLSANSFIKYFTENGIMLFLTSFELIDNFNNLDYSDILYETIFDKLKNRKSLQKQYKKDFIKFHSEENNEDNNSFGKV